MSGCPVCLEFTDSQELGTPKFRSAGTRRLPEWQTVRPEKKSMNVCKLIPELASSCKKAPNVSIYHPRRLGLSGSSVVTFILS